MVEFEIDSVSICSNFEKPPEQSLNDCIRTASKLDMPSQLRNRIVDIDEDNEMESALGVGVIGGGNPMESTTNYLEFDSLDGEDRIHIHIQSENEYMSDFTSFYSDLLDIVGEGEADPIVYHLSVDKRFDELGLDIDITLPDSAHQEIHQVTGARFDIGDENMDYLLQQNPNTGDTQIRFGTGPTRVDSNSAENLIQSELEEAIEFIEEL